MVDVDCLDHCHTHSPHYFLVWSFQQAPHCLCPACLKSQPGSTMMIFSAIPWTLAGGLLGPFAAAGIGHVKRINTRDMGYAYVFLR